MWIGCLPSSEPTTGRGEDSTWPSYPPALRWAVHTSPESVRSTFLEPTYLCVHCIIFIQVFMLTTICNFCEGFPDVWGKSVQDCLFIFLVWRTGTKRCLMKFSGAGVVRMLGFVSSEKWSLCYCLLFTAEWKHKGLSTYLKSVFFWLEGVGKFVKFIYWKRPGKNNTKGLANYVCRSGKLM